MSRDPLLPEKHPARTALRICGLAAVRARFAAKPDSIQRLYFDLPTGKKIGMICRYLAAGKKIYRCVEPAELEKIGGSIHHGGIVAVVPEPEWRRPTSEDISRWARGRETLLLLDRIGNAHNLGALARTAAFFGVDHLIFSGAEGAARPGDAAYRTAEGGLESLHVWRVDAMDSFLRELTTAGYLAIGAATQGGKMQRPDPANKSPRALVLGNEEYGLSPLTAKACSQLVTIPTRSNVESLNVSVAGAILMWEYLARRNQ